MRQKVIRIDWGIEIRSMICEKRLLILVIHTELSSQVTQLKGENTRFWATQGLNISV